MQAWMKTLIVAVAITAMNAGLGGCQAPGDMHDAKPDQQPVSKTPADSWNIPESDGPAINDKTYIAAGRLHESQNRPLKAVEQYKLAIAAKPDNVEALNRLGIVLDRLGRFKEADDAFKKAIQTAPKQGYLHNNLAFSYIMQSRWQDAEAALKKAIELSPTMARAQVNMAMALAQQEKYDEAFGHFQAVLLPEDAYYNMGLMYQSKQKLAEAAKSFKTALTINPKMTAAQKRLEAMPKEAATAAIKIEPSAPIQSPKASPVVTPHPQVSSPATSQPAVQKNAELCAEEAAWIMPLPSADDPDNIIQ